MTHSNVTLDENDSLLVHEFHTRIQKAMVFIERTCLTSGSTSGGTGTVIGYQGNRTDGWLPLIASAGHVLRATIGAQSKFKIHQFDWTDPANPTSRVLEFATGGTSGRDPDAATYTGPFNDIVDIGILRCPELCTDGTKFLPVGIDGEPAEGTMAIEAGHNYSAEGTRVAWAGFPGLARQAAQRPQPCYFEGVVSALILRNDYQMYLIDGHNTFGVSGGPVWALDGEKRRSRLIGVVSGYRHHADAPAIPGLVHVVPIQPLRMFLEQVWKAKTRQ